MEFSRHFFTNFFIVDQILKLILSLYQLRTMSEREKLIKEGHLGILRPNPSNSDILLLSLEYVNFESLR